MFNYKKTLISLLLCLSFVTLTHKITGMNSTDKRPLYLQQCDKIVPRYYTTIFGNTKEMGNGFRAWIYSFFKPVYETCFQLRWLEKCVSGQLPGQDVKCANIWRLYSKGIPVEQVREITTPLSHELKLGVTEEKKANEEYSTYVSNILNSLRTGKRRQ